MSESLKVIIVEDDRFQRMVLKSMLKHFSVEEVVEFDNGKSAHDFFKKLDNEYDILFLDLNLPGYDGLKLLDFLQENKFIKNIVVLSGAGEDVLKSVKSYVSSNHFNILNVLKKPIAGHEFVLVIDNVVQNKLKKMEDSQKKRFEVAESSLSIADIEKAIKNREFVAFFQPQIDLETNKVVGAEALARWMHPELGLIPPYKFIPVLESSPLQIKKSFTYLMLERAIETLDRLNEIDSFEEFKISVNVFISLFENESMCDRIASWFNLLKRNYMKNIVFEVTESGLSRDKKMLNYSLTRLRLKGFELSLDDFGTGYSSLKQLAESPFTELKIDRAFVANIHNDKKNFTIAKMAAMLGRELNLKVIAEGCEVEKEVDVLKNLNVDVAQGYFFAKPMPFYEFKDFVIDFNSK
ncbi:two-component system response regulator [Thermotomaculum hydrothermale]|uniref:Two-component system response regulator n=1 Tax=Thermotomaculum hydrothermale TaxID=981385 RepID=A0A7R6SYK8_9BACT|nr:EAL domain-containing response regulator [Thermotomaculum hydrothermale]BBB32894.1 two-component system response regulator [Thermotomaculum hydrothermale]